MTSPEQLSAWTGLGTMLGIICVAVRSELRAMSVRRIAKEEHTATQEAIVVTQDAVAKVESLVNGPLSIALKAGADFAAHLAKATNKDADILAAIVAQKLSDDHAAQTRAIAEFRAAALASKAATV
jgi:hypothetical protein